ncbi:hypothetical protein BGZ76_007416 [Entomortierella beljakovae]|nr:hypothetical protein BGZ76_007416 [Entomortierella beljakovae]
MDSTMERNFKFLETGYGYFDGGPAFRFQRKHQWRRVSGLAIYNCVIAGLLTKSHNEKAKIVFESEHANRNKGIPDTEVPIPLNARLGLDDKQASFDNTFNVQ